MPRPLKQGKLCVDSIILSKDIDEYAFMCSLNFYETDVIFSIYHIQSVSTSDWSIFLKWYNFFKGSCPELGTWENVQRLEMQNSDSIGDSHGGEEAGEA
jgi:hypothetical protein